jgi:hypothetical protein
MTPDEERREILIVCEVVGTTMLIVAITVYFSLVAVNWTQVKEALDAVKNGMTIVAIVIGGIWTYYNFIKGKIYSPRIEVHITGRVIKKEGFSYLVAIAQLKNVGTVRVSIDNEATVLIVHSYEFKPEKVTDMRDAPTKRLGVPKVFVEHEWVNPGTVIEDQKLFLIPDGEKLAFRIQLHVTYNNKKAGGRSDNKEVETGAIVEYSSEPAAEELTVNLKGEVTYGRKR